ncbi:biotin transporter BioY [bacterium]|nr:biotin transporter BioY [bacterium]
MGDPTVVDNRLRMGAALFAALTAVSGLVRIPVGTVPFTLQTLFVYLSGMVLGRKYGTVSQLVFLTVGLLGLPVFTGGSGPAAVGMPTFGYLASFPTAAWLAARLTEKPGKPAGVLRTAIFLTPCWALILLAGSFYFYASLKWWSGRGISLSGALVAGGLIFIPAEILKTVLAAMILKKTGRMFRTAVVLVVLMSGAAAFGQSSAGLSRIREEIRKIEKEIRAKEARETTLLEQLEDMERRIGLQKKLTFELADQQRLKEKDVAEAEIRVGESFRSLTDQKALVGRRMANLYKKGRMSDWETLLTMKSVNQALVWVKYQKRIMENDERNLRLLAEKQAAFSRRKEILDGELAEKVRLMREMRSETESLESAKRERTRLLNEVRREKKPLQEALEQKRAAFREIQDWMAREEEKRRIERESASRTAAEKPKQPAFRSSELSGKLAWPVTGRIVSRFGKQRDPELKTWTENLGLEIQASENEPVKAVADGQIKRVDWLRGMGNLVFLDHGGYYTVYGHLETVQVALGETVKAGRVLGQVGDKNSFYGSTLHFEVWKGITPNDPEKWLR